MSCMNIKLLPIILLIVVFACAKKETLSPVKGTYAYDADFLNKNSIDVIELSDADGQSKILLSAEFQGRVMTSTAKGDSGTSYGWINYDLISSGKKNKQFNAVGGEERFWLGPEGGQFSLYFAPGDSFAISKWQVNAIIDTTSFDVKSNSKTEVVFTKDGSLINYSGEEFSIGVERTVSLIDHQQIEMNFSIKLPTDIRSVAYKTKNTIANKGVYDWTKENGLLSVWLLGMMTPTENTIVIIPFHSGTDAKKKITTTYFGDIPADRLQIYDSVLFFKCDGKYRSKIGLSPDIAKPVAGSFDFKKNILTVIQFPVDKDSAYVNSKWEIQSEPYKGDVVNSYNDGPLANGTQLGPFYELESSSRALALKRGASGSYVQSTYHFEGEFESLNELSKQILGVELNSIRAEFR
jgi:hypothetical protein